MAEYVASMKTGNVFLDGADQDCAYSDEDEDRRGELDEKPVLAGGSNFSVGQR